MTPVLLLTRRLGLGGSERQMVEMAKALDPQRFEVHVGCLRAEGVREAELRERGLPILELNVPSFLSPTAFSGAWKLLRYVRDHRIALVHSFDTPMNVYATPIAWMARVPVVLTSQRADRGLTAASARWILRATDRLTDGIVVNCEFMRRHMMHEEKVRETKIHVCYNGMDTDAFQPEGKKIDLFAFPRLAGASAVIGTVCALRPEKGLGTLVSAFANVAKDWPGARLLIVGSGPELVALEKQVRELRIEASCTFVPTVTEVAMWLRAIDIFVLPSLSEAFSNSLMEAMGCGCCCVASRVGGNPELAGDPQRGVMFEAGNSEELARVLRELLADPSKRKSLANFGSVFVRREFPTAASVAQLEQIYALHLGAGVG